MIGPQIPLLLAPRPFSPYRLPNTAAIYSLDGDAADSSYLTTSASFSGTGTATSTLISTAFVGVGTAFLAELAQGDTVYNGSAALIGTIASVTNNTNAVLVANGAAAITGAAFLIIKSGPRVRLIADRSGNSAVNGLVLNGASGNYASTPDSAAISITGDIDIRGWIAPVSWAGGVGFPSVMTKDNFPGSDREWEFNVATNGALQFVWFDSGGTQRTATSTVLLSFSNGTPQWVRVTMDVDNGASNNEVYFYTSIDGVTWTQLGVVRQLGSTTSIRDQASSLRIGAIGVGANAATGLVMCGQLRNGIGGTVVFDVDFTLAAKLATSIVESSTNAATVTINSSGDLGARISGARDLVQLTAAKQPVLSAPAGYNIATFDGVNDYMKAAAFTLVQPETVVLVGAQVTWTSGGKVYDGNDNSSGRMTLYQKGITPDLSLFAGSAPTDFIAPTLAIFAVIQAEFNGALSFLKLNRNTAVTTSPGTNGANGFTLAAQGDGAAGWGNIQVTQILIFSVALPISTLDKISSWFARRFNITV